MMALPLAFLAALVGYPFFYGILLSLEDRPVAHTGTFVGLKNFITDGTIRCSGGWRSTRSSIPASRRC
jgi:ABC-type sugar transport systems, permease components